MCGFFSSSNKKEMVADCPENGCDGEITFNISTDRFPQMGMAHLPKTCKPDFDGGKWTHYDERPGYKLYTSRCSSCRTKRGLATAKTVKGKGIRPVRCPTCYHTVMNWNGNTVSADHVIERRAEQFGVGDVSEKYYVKWMTKGVECPNPECDEDRVYVKVKQSDYDEHHSTLW